MYEGVEVWRYESVEVWKGSVSPIAMSEGGEAARIDLCGLLVLVLAHSASMHPRIQALPGQGGAMRKLRTKAV